MSGTHGRIPDSFIQELLAKTDIVSVIQESIKLKKNGANYSACCPFHHEKTPSFTVSQTKQFYHCFGCSAHGDAIRFLMDYQSLNFVDAIENLSARVGLTVPKDPQEAAKAQVKHTMTTVLKRCADFYAQQLKTHPEAKLAVDYLKKRGLTGQVAKQFNIGFAPTGWQNLLSYFSESEINVLEESGMIIRHKEGRLYDRFRERIMFPIRDRRGEVIGFGARVMDKSQPKYLNSPESSVFQKSYCLYGLYEAQKAKQQWQTAIVVEGYMDVVALAQMGISGAVATLGTAITSHHLNTLFHIVPEVVFCFDGDKAGQSAAWKALQLVLGLLTEGRQVRFVFLPQGEDPDSYVRQYGANAFLSLVKNGTPLSEYFFATLSAKIAPNSVDSRAHLASVARPLIETIPKGIFKEMMFEQLANLVSSTPQVVRGEKAFRSFYSPKGQTRLKVAPPPPPMETAYLASAMLLRAPNLHALIGAQSVLVQEIQAPGIALFHFLCNLLSQDPATPSTVMHQKLQENNFEVARLKACETKIAMVPNEGLEAEFLGAIKRLEVVGREQMMEKLILKAKNRELSEQEKEMLKEFLKTRESIG
ncbi:MAG: DNA primase [Candidatus Berkiella sp.]